MGPVKAWPTKVGLGTALVFLLLVLTYLLVRFAHLFATGVCTRQACYFEACKSSEITLTTFVEWAPVVYEGEEALDVLIEALPSEYDRGLVRLTIMWKSQLSYISTELPDQKHLALFF
jgi:hypothetical protein